MRRVSFYIAWRYLFAKKRHNAINIVSAVSAMGVGIATAALVCVLSVMNGFGALVEDMFSNFDPQLRITAVDGKSFTTDNEAFAQLRSLPIVDVYAETVEETALIRFADKQVPVIMKGVDTTFAALTQIDSILFDGHFLVYDGAFERAVLGVGLANQIGIGAYFVNPIKIYCPRRTARVNMLRPDKNFREAGVFIAGIFTVQQTKYDDHYMLVSLGLARDLLEYTDHQATAVELKLQPNVKIRDAKRQIASVLGTGYQLQDRYEQQADFFRIMKIEKLLTMLLLVFILLIASFNIIGSLSMLMIDKRDDCRTLWSLGADNQLIRRIFLYEGWSISVLGALVGLVLGLVLCLLQQHFGLLKLGNGSEYVISAYPVQVQLPDILVITVVILLLGWLAAWIPSRRVKIVEQ